MTAAKRWGRELGLDEHAGVHDLAGAISDARRRLKSDLEVRRLRSQLGQIENALKYALEPLPGEANDNEPTVPEIAL